MKLAEIIKAIQTLNETEQYRLKEFFNQSLASFSASEPVFKEISNQKTKRDIPARTASQPRLSVMASIKLKLD